MSSIGEGVKPSLYQPAPSDMSRLIAEKSWEGKALAISHTILVTWQTMTPFFVIFPNNSELRRDSRQLENEIDAKLNSFSKLSSNYLHSR